MVARTKICKVGFYIAEGRLQQSAIDWQDDVFPSEDVVTALDASTPAAARLEINGEQYLGLVRKKKLPSHVVIYRIRHDGLPLLEQDGEFSPLELDEKAGLAEPTELMFFGSGVVARLLTRDGPGQSTCMRYIEERTGVDAVMVALTYENVMEQVSANDEVSSVEIRIAADNIDTLAAGAKGLRDGARQTANATGSGSIELILRPTRHQKEGFWGRVRPIISRLQKSPDVVHLEKLKVIRQNTEFATPETVDFLQDKITAWREVPLLGDSRHVEPEAARKAMIAAYNEHLPSINRALKLMGKNDDQA